MRTCFDLQQRQQAHDEGYHRDVLGFPLPRRIAHLLVHFAKYTGRMAQSAEKEAHYQKLDVSRTLADTMIIALSLANACGMKLFGIRLDEMPEVTLMGPSGSPAQIFLERLALANGRLCKIYDDADHGTRPLNEDPFRGEVARLIHDLLEFAAMCQIDLPRLVQEKWAALERS